MAVDTETQTDNIIVLSTLEALRNDSSFYDIYADLPWNPDVIVKKKGDLSIYDKMRRDDQIKAVLNLKKFMVVSSGWEIKPFKDKEKEQTDIITELTDNLNDLDEPDFNTALLDMLTYIDYGFSITEPIFKLVNNRWKLNKLKTRAPHTFREINTDIYGNIELMIQETSDKPILIKSKDLKKLIYIVHQPDFGNPFGTSDLQAAYNAWFSKTMIMRFWNIYLERFGNPTVITKIPMGMKQEEKDELDKVLKNMQPKNGIRIPEAINIDIIFPPTGNNQYEKAIDKYNMMISRSMLVPDLIGIGGSETTGGSFALGEKQFEMFFLTVEKMRSDIERGVNSKAIKQLCLVNHGLKDECPEWRLKPLKDSDKIKLMTLWVSALKTKQWKASDEEINTFRRQAGFPDGDVDRFAEGQPGGQPENQSDFTQSKKKVNLIKLKREKTKFEQVVNFTEIDRELKELNKQGQALIVPIFQKMEEGVINDLQTKKLVEKQNIEGTNKLTLKFKKDLEISFRRLLRNAMDEGKGSANDEIKKLGLPEVKMMATPLPELFEKSIDDIAFFITGVESDRILNRSKQIIISGIEAGATVQSVTFDLRQFFDKDYNFTSARVENIVRTNTIKAYNFGRRRMFEAPELKGFIVAYQFSAIIDPRTSDVCDQLDGNIYLIEDSYISRITPPVHFSCRSILVPITSDESFEVSPKVDLEEFPESKNFVPSV